MASNFNNWPRWWQNDPHIARKSYGTPNKFDPNICSETKLLMASYKGFCTAKKLIQELEEKQEV